VNDELHEDEAEVIEDEEIIDESTSPDERKVRVYDAKGDFIITVPPGATITFGYFNPASPKFDTRGGGGWNDQPSAVARATALRIYKGGTSKTSQLACFVGVKGFRDESIKLTRLSQRVVIETGYVNDGAGNVEEHRKQQKQIVAAPEPDTYQ
jgi:hypothetical protein